MNFHISNKIKIFLSSLIAAVVLLLAVFSGLGSGKNKAQTEFLVLTSQNTVLALQYFYKDQNRYPSVEEFGSQNLMLDYMTNFPLPNLPSENCSQSFVYKRTDPTNFSLSFCLPMQQEPYRVGWNTVNGFEGE